MTAHQSHNLSYSKYLALFNAMKKEQQRGSNHFIPKKEVDILSNEYITNLQSFSNTIKIKIKKMREENNKKYNFSGVIKEEKEIFHTLCKAIVDEDIAQACFLFDFIKQCNHTICFYNHHPKTGGHAYSGGLLQVFHSFLRAYLLINTFVYAGYHYNYFAQYFQTTSNVIKLSAYFSDAFVYCSNDISGCFQTKHREIIDKIRTTSEIVTTNELHVLSKEMFRLMYITYAILTIEKENEENVNNEISEIICSIFHIHK